MRQPAGLEQHNPHGTPLVCRLNKAVYGLKQSGREWWKTVTNAFVNMNFHVSHSEPCLFIRKSGHQVVALIALYVDDIALASQSLDIIKQVNSTLVFQNSTSRTWEWLTSFSA